MGLRAADDEYRARSLFRGLSQCHIQYIISPGQYALLRQSQWLYKHVQSDKQVLEE